MSIHQYTLSNERLIPLTKKVTIILTLAVFLIGGYYIGNFILNKALTNKVENILKNENIQKEIDKLVESNDLEKELSHLLPEDILKGDTNKEDKVDSPNNKNLKSSQETQITPVSSTGNEQKNNAVEGKTNPEPQETPQEKVEPTNPETEQPQFATKNEAIEFVRSKFTSKEIAELYKIYSEALKDGLTAEEKKALKEIAYKEAFKKFTPQEIEAVKKIIFGES